MLVILIKKGSKNSHKLQARQVCVHQVVEKNPFPDHKKQIRLRIKVFTGCTGFVFIDVGCISGFNQRT